LLVYANKQDLKGALSEEEIREILGLDDITKQGRHWHIQPCSAVSGEGLREGIAWLVKDIASRVYMLA
jgi:ADP-ribosylation factor-like protein 2